MSSRIINRDGQSDCDIVLDAIEVGVTPANIYQSGEFPARTAGPFLPQAEFDVFDSSHAVTLN